MADRWIDIAYVDARMGINARQSLTDEESVDMNAFIEAGTSYVQGLVRAAGYTTPATITDELCKMAVYAVVYELISDAPDNSLARPDGWEQSIHKLTLVALREGDIQPTLALASTGAAIGGWTVSSDPAVRSSMAATTTDLCCPNEPRVPRATRCQLRGY